MELLCDFSIEGEKDLNFDLKPDCVLMDVFKSIFI